MNKVDPDRSAANGKVEQKNGGKKEEEEEVDENGKKKKKKEEIKMVPFFSVVCFTFLPFHF